MIEDILTKKSKLPFVLFILIGAVLLGIVFSFFLFRTKNDGDKILGKVGTVVSIGGPIIEKRVLGTDDVGDVQGSFLRVYHNKEREVNVVYNTALGCKNIKGKTNAETSNVGDIILIRGSVIKPETISICDSEEFTVENLGNKTLCDTNGGAWDLFGKVKFEQCNVPTNDGGKICASSAECEADCIAELSEEEEAQVKQGEAIKKTGTCTSHTLDFYGCHAYVEEGTVAAILCAE